MEESIMDVVNKCEQKRKEREEEEELTKGGKELQLLHQKFNEIADVNKRIDFLKDLEIDDVVALREIYIKQLVVVQGKLLGNIELITNFVHKL